MRSCRHIFNVIVFIFTFTLTHAQSEEELNASATKLFEKEQYVEATSYYLRLISLHPKNYDYNFRYGTCLLYNSFQKEKAIRYLSFAITEPTIDPRAFYFHGKSLHLNFQFDDAIKSYKKYIEKRGNRDKRYNVEREIEMCENGKKLLVTFTDIVVSEKQEIDKEKFFRLYKNMETIGGDILVSEEFQSKLDKKNGHVPIVHFPPQAKAIYYSSYGDNGSTGLDIYIRRRLPDGSWGDPQILPGQVNSPDDEDFPFMHPSGDFLYFSSKGHNSMGGYDIFFSRYNPDINAFGKPENVDFAISSPDDDFFYVVDAEFKGAYFASARQSENGKLHVYNVRVARVPIQQVIVMGDFISEINPKNETMRIKVTQNSNGSEIGKIVSNEQGKYSFVFPKGGKYNYEITIDGKEDVYKFLVELPFLDEFKPLKQKAVHKMVDGEEIVTIINLFDEDVEGAEAIIAEVIRKKSSLDVNIDNFDLKELDQQLERNKVLAEIGFENMTMEEINGQLGDLAKMEKEKAITIERLEANLDMEVLANADNLQQLEIELNEVLNKAENASDPIVKHQLLLKAKSIEAELNQITTEIALTTSIKEEILKNVGSTSTTGVSKMEVLENQFKSLIAQEKEEEALSLLTKNKALINKTRDESPEKFIQQLVEESIALNENIKTLKNRQLEYELTESKLNSQINQLKNQLIEAKKKEAEQIKAEINNKTAELELVKEVLSDTKKIILTKNNELNALNNTISSLKKAISNDELVAYKEEDLQKVLNKAKAVKVSSTENSIDQQLAILEAENPELNPDYVPDVNALVEKDLVAIQTELKKEIAAIEANNALSAEEKINAKRTINNESIAEINERFNQLEQKLVASPNDASVLNEQTALMEYKSELEAENKALNEQLLALNNSTVEPKVTKEEVLTSVSPEYLEKSREIKSNESLSEIEKLNEQQSIDQELVKELQKALTKTEKNLSKQPEDANEQAKKQFIEELIAQKESEVAERTQVINAKNQVSSVTDIAEVKSTLLEEVGKNYTQEKESIENSVQTTYEKSVAILDLGVEQLDRLEQKEATIEKAIKRNSSDETLLVQKQAIEELIQEQKEEIEALKLRAVSSISTQELAEKVATVDPNYATDIDQITTENGPTKGNDLAEREVVLQEKLQASIEAKEKALKRSYSVTVELEKALFERVLEESKEREANARSGTDSSDPLAAIAEVRSTNEREIAVSMNSNPTTKSELERNDEVLAAYEQALKSRIAEVTEEMNANSSEELANEKQVLEEELEEVQKKRRQFSVSFGELETNLVASNESNERLNEIGQEKQAILEKLNDENVSSSEKKQLQKELSTLDNQQAEIQNEQSEKSLNESKKENEALITELSRVASSNSVLAEKTTEVNEAEVGRIESIKDAAASAKSETEKQHLLQEAEERQSLLNSTLKEVVATQKQIDLEESENISVTSREELEVQKRKFSIQIGDLTTQIVATEKEIDNAKKRDIPALETKKQQLINQRSLLEIQLRTIEERLVEEKQPVTPVVTAESLEQTISFNEERKLASSENYEPYYELATKTLETEREIAILESQLSSEQKRVRSLLEMQLANENAAEMQLSVEKIKNIEEQIDRLKIEHTQQKYAADQLLPENTQEAMNMQNLVLRGIKPIQATLLATSLIAMPSTGFAIDAEAPSAYTAENPIPIDVESPSGLYYRVQIGAFAKPIPQDLFSEFTPVSGEKIEGSNIVRYMAGFFNNSATVTDARGKIRDLGYSDAFIVAYCDGKRINFGEARRLEAQGLCVPKGENELVLEVVTKTAEKLGIPMTAEVQEVPEVSYNQSPGAAQADPIELKKGLFFTVQVGVYNRPIAAESVFGMDELITLRLPNGQIRYSSGVFNSVDEAKPRRTEALENGVNGAFITAYYNGERISLTEAKRLLDEKGTAILQSEIEKNTSVEQLLTPSKGVRTDSVSLENVTTSVEVNSQKIQLVSKKRYEEFPRDELNRFNAEGNFYYDQGDKRLKSIIYNNEDDLPRLWNFRNDIDTVYLASDEVELLDQQVVVVKMASASIPGDLMDWLNQQSYQRSFDRSEEGVEITLSGIERKRILEVQTLIRNFGVSAEVRDAVEVEFSE